MLIDLSYLSPDKAASFYDRKARNVNSIRRIFSGGE